MKTTKRILSLVLCFAMFLGMLPMFTLGADAAETPLAAAIFGSDIHEENTGLTGSGTSAMKSILSTIKSNGVTYSTIGFVGDTYTDKAGTMAAMTSAAQTALGQNAEVYYAYGDHDEESDISPDSGLLYTGDYYYIYHISDANMRSSTASQSEIGYETAISNFKTAAESMDKTKVLFIMSHVPLHDRRDDNTYANAWYTAIKGVADTMEVVFFWAHNHTNEANGADNTDTTDVDAYYVARDGDETMTIYGGETVTPNFTYMNAGYIYAAGQSPMRKGVVTTVEIYADTLVFQDYSSSGEYTDTNYSHNVTVTREFTGTSSGDSGSTDTTDPTDSTDGEEEDGTTTTTTTYNYTATANTDGTGYILVSNGYALQNNDGTIGAVAVTVSNDGSTVTFDSSVDVSTILWTIDSDGDVMNDGYYLLRGSGSGTKSMTISTTDSGDAYSNWTYSSDTLTTTGGSSGSTTFYAYCSEGTFYTQSDSSQELKFYVPTVDTSSGGDSTDEGEDDTTTGGSTETTVGEGTYTTADDGSYQKVTFGTEGETKTVYVLVSTPTAGKNYIIASGNSGTVYALKENTTTGTSVTVNAATDSITAPYIENSDNTIVWTASSGMNFKSVNGGYYLNYTQSSSGSNKPDSGYSLSFSTSSASEWAAGTNSLYRDGSQNDYYLRYNSGWTMGGQNTKYNVYFYEEQTIDTSSSVTYSVTASDIEHFCTADETDTETATITKSVTEGTPNGTYTYEIVEGSDNIITSISEDGTITFNGTEGTAQVKISYSWTEGEGDDAVTYTIWQVIDVTATAPYYSINLHEAVINYTAVEITEFEDGVTYFTYDSETDTYTKVTGEYVEDTAYFVVEATVGDEITSNVALKGKQAGDTYFVWAVIKEHNAEYPEGEDLGNVEDGRIYWVSSNTNIATVDAATGEITFTGKEYGTFDVTAFYLDEDGKILCQDTITISVTESQYVVIGDGTNDFPEYPNEGSVRYDKTAVAVGNFSETGIAKLELSMTGVPYSTGSEIDVVLMLDMTGSMSGSLTSGSIAAAITSAKSFAEQIVKNEDDSFNKNRISVQCFSKDGASILWDLSAVTEDTYDDLITAIESAVDKQEQGGTPYSTALQSCYETLYAASRAENYTRSQYCVFVSDGTPTSVTYITDTTTPTSTTTVSFTMDGTTYTQTVPAYTTGSTSSTYESSENSYHEYWSQLMINNDVTVYGVYTSAAAGSSSSSGGNSVNDTATGAICMGKVASSSDKVYTVSDYTDTSAITNVFSNIALDIKQAAIDVVVADEITDEYTMIFDIPTGSKTISAEDTGNQDFYIEVTEYTLTAVYDTTDTTKIVDYVRGTGTSKIKLYLAKSNSVYYAASDANGTAFAAPTFANTTLGTSGTHYYWTTDSTKGDQDVSVVAAAGNVSTTTDGTTTTNTEAVTLYFVSNGSGEYNMTGGAYAYGTINDTNTSTDLIIATPYFVYNAEEKMIVWTAEKLSSTELALTYFLYLDNSATEAGEDDEVDPDTYPTNVEATITYTNFNSNRCQQKFPVPQMTWKGAQVSYVFYLVNEDGDPVNRAGRVIPFSEAIYVTDVYTHSVVWNEEESVTSLNAAQLAADLVPDVYQLYDLQAYYEIDVYMDTSGTNKDHFIIEGSALNTEQSNGVTVANTETTKVFNTKADSDHRYTTYGAYSNVSGTYTSQKTNISYEATVVTDFDYSNTTVAFAVVWSPELVPDTVVIDYGLDVVIDVTTNDALASGVTGVMTTAPDADINEGAYATAVGSSSVDIYIDGLKVGTASSENNNEVRFSLDKTNGMQMSESVMFYYESAVNYYNSADKLITTNMYSSVTVIPATTVYYEDTFLTLTSYSKVDGTFTEDETSKWDTAGTADSDTQDVDRPGESSAVMPDEYDADNVYGYDSAYTSMSTYSLGSAAKISVDAETRGEATFTFYGTGFDVIGMTSNMTGTMTVQVYSGAEASGTAVKTSIVDTYYGYTQDNDGEWITSVNDPNALYQVPVMKISGLTYGQYTVKIVAAYNNYFNHTATEGGYDLYLDAVRIYDPTGNNDTDANAAYVKDGEGWPIYKELRNLLIDAESFGSDLTVDSTGSDEVTVNGAVFIDSVDSTTSIDAYTSYGPNNELYLAAGQAVAFSIGDAFVNSSNETIDPVKVQLAIKSVGTTDANVQIFNPGTSTSTVTNDDNTTTTTTTFVKDNLMSQTVKTATDMYYDITDLADGTIVITNSGTAGIISITNIKFTFEEAASVATVTTTNEDGTEETSEASVASISEEGAVYSLRSLSAYSISETSEPEVTEPEATEPEATEPEVTEPEATEPEETEPTVEEQINTIVNQVVSAIKQLFGWLFG